jgi:glutamyl-Q tRNA(Asp) synthetase
LPRSEDLIPAGRRVYRFAPTPNGYLHRGHAFSALLNERAARATGGRFLLRIEDIDPVRARPAFEAAIFDDLEWLRLGWEEPVLRQRERFDAYRAALTELDRLGLLYPAFLSRSEVAQRAGRDAPRDPEGAPLYPGDERTWSAARRRTEMASGRPYSLRLDMARAIAGAGRLAWWETAEPAGEATTLRPADPSLWGDVILARREIPASYHLAVVIDDAYQQVTDVVRGQDLEGATAVHRLLQALLGLAEPRYHHHRLILDAKGEKLAKSRGSETLRARRAAGETTAALIAGLGL